MTDLMLIGEEKKGSGTGSASRTSYHIKKHLFK